MISYLIGFVIGIVLTISYQLITSTDEEEDTKRLLRKMKRVSLKEKEKLKDSLRLLINKV
ncbi:hypothetical protein AUJ63_05290 [Candidatus Pacearchaeota archaeon CG1_02_35_32]|nr:MAG: hypothetical protein AUJ63_05290 [Candidatus Pacearchaeota archaeon CG1_02_35_32]